ncbi:GNAT family N-acetyltransferase [Streptomyces sp. NPDC093595]|uniref:GNAT family N-acetyltransferase n=1 Tax=Streptomyces sp. NPDC093595 TaxID=3366045 RepID=UPI0038129AE2
MEHLIRPLRSDEWRKARDIRLAALRDPIAHLAFLDTYEAAAARPDEHWQERTAGAAEGNDGIRQFVAEAPDGTWDGTATVLVEHRGVESLFGDVPVVQQTQVVGVYVRPAARGAGLADALFRAALEWSWSLEGEPVQRVRLHVHEENARARAFYRKLGFEPTGAHMPEKDGHGGALELEYEVRRPVTR